MLLSLQQGGVAHMQGMMSHQGLGQQMVHQAPGAGPQMQGQWRQPLGGQNAVSSDKTHVTLIHCHMRTHALKLFTLLSPSGQGCKCHL